jgi:hypothetical protein
MKVQIGSVVFIDPTWDELDELIRRYGQSVDTTTAGSEPRSSLKTGLKTSSSNGVADGVILQQMVECGPSGVPTNELGQLLGSMGRGIRPALGRWASRIHLVEQGGNIDPFEECRVGTRRAVRLKGAFEAVAKGLLDQRT